MTIIPASEAAVNKRLAALDKKMYEEALATSFKASFSTKERQAYFSGLDIYRINKKEIFLSASVHQEERTSASHARYWYRTMCKEEFNSWERNNRYIPHDNKDYGGVAPYCEYVRQFYKSKATHIVEFQLPAGITMDDLLNEAKERLQKAKKEAAREKRVKVSNTGVHGNKGEGGGSVGLGPQGNYKGFLGDVFNAHLERGEITWRLVELMVSNPLPNHEYFYIRGQKER